VVWWNNFDFSLPLKNGSSSSIHLRFVWRQFYYIMETITFQYLLLMHFSWKFKVYCKKCVTKTISGTYVSICKLCQLCLGCKEVIGNFVFFPMWMGQSSEWEALPWKVMATPRSNDSRSEECSTSNISWQDESIFTSTSPKPWIN